MRRSIIKMSLLGLALVLSFGFCALPNVSAEEESSDETPAPAGTSISLTPASKILQLSSNSVYDETFSVDNDGSSTIKVEIYAAPYSYVYSSEEDSYKLGFNNENKFTQISRWISFKDSSGKYVDKATFNIEPESTLDVSFKVSTPENIPSGGQYAVIFVHTLTPEASGSGIKTEASPGMVIYGRSTEGEATIAAKISDAKIERGMSGSGSDQSNFYGSAKVKNDGNVDFNASGVLIVKGLFGNVKYETPGNEGIVSIIPETELLVADEWENTPSFGIYKITWTVNAGDESETIERMVFLIPPLAIILIIIVLTFITIWIIILVRRRKERRSRLAV